MERDELLKRITFNPKIYGGKAIVRGRRLAVEHVLEMLSAGDTPEGLVEAYDWLELDDIHACLLYGARLAGNEFFDVEPAVADE
ncbi:MAG TPA: DUF433 domain-containing protein [Thermoanaerobaculia bacterium]|nr:DUF433 domain-containing protein [Thermoanaerobaculia bacterium]